MPYRNQRQVLQKKEAQHVASPAASHLSHRPADPLRDLLALQQVVGNQAVTFALQQVENRENGVPPFVRSVLSAAGQPLDAATRATMEERFGHDFSQVRLHTDGPATSSADDLNAQAYTVGQHIVFGKGRYIPQTSEGKRLLAHELTHVVQQSSGTGLSPSSMSEARTEREAEQVSQTVLQSQQPIKIAQQSSVGIARQAAGGETSDDELQTEYLLTRQWLAQHNPGESDYERASAYTQQLEQAMSTRSIASAQAVEQSNDDADTESEDAKNSRILTALGGPAGFISKWLEIEVEDARSVFNTARGKIGKSIRNPQTARKMRQAASRIERFKSAERSLEKLSTFKRLAKWGGEVLNITSAIDAAHDEYEHSYAVTKPGRYADAAVTGFASYMFGKKRPYIAALDATLTKGELANAIITPYRFLALITEADITRDPSGVEELIQASAEGKHGDFAWGLTKAGDVIGDVAGMGYIKLNEAGYAFNKAGRDLQKHLIKLYLKHFHK